MIKKLIEAVLSAGFDINYRRTRLADAYVDYDKEEIVIGKNEPICLVHECVHVLYDEIFEEGLPEKEVEKSAEKLLRYAI
jgi:hypothetical protein